MQGSPKPACAPGKKNPYVRGLSRATTRPHRGCDDGPLLPLPTPWNCQTLGQSPGLSNRETEARGLGPRAEPGPAPPLGAPKAPTPTPPTLFPAHIHPGARLRRDRASPSFGEARMQGAPTPLISPLLTLCHLPHAAAPTSQPPPALPPVSTSGSTHLPEAGHTLTGSPPCLELPGSLLPSGSLTGPATLSPDTRHAQPHRALSCPDPATPLTGRPPDPSAEPNFPL